jgi:hypothetical protein
MIKCRPDILFHISKLSQSLANPAKEHYEAVKLVSQYLAMTIEEGFYFWHEKPRMDLPEGPKPTPYPDTYVFHKDFSAIERVMYALSDSDWASCRKTRNAITGGIVMLAGAAIGYKTKFQNAVALSSTEAEWVAACEVGKMILFSGPYWRILGSLRMMLLSFLKAITLLYSWRMLNRHPPELDTSTSSTSPLLIGWNKTL